MGPGLRRAVFAAATLAVVVACRQLVGIGDSPPAGTVAVDSGTAEAGGSEASACGIEYAPAACEACLASSCCPEATACSGSPACSAFEGCMGPCAGDPTCRAGCVQSARVGADPTVPAFESCMVRSCGTPCGLLCGGVAEVAIPDAAGACQACFQAQGCPAAQACLSDPACSATAFCVIEALTPSLAQGCLVGDGGVDASAFESVALSCAAACDLQTNWSCVGHPVAPPGLSGDLTILLSVVDGPTQAPVPDVIAKVCNSADVGCGSPSATGTTDSQGTVPLVQHVDAGPAHANGYIDLSGGGIIPEVFFWSFPLSQSPSSLHATSITPMELADFLPTLPVTLVAGTGYVFVQGYDCVQFMGVGMTFAIVPRGSSQIFYQQGATFSPGLTATGPSGGAIFINVPIGGSELTASVAAAGGPIGQFNLFVRDGGLTQVWALPN